MDAQYLRLNVNDALAEALTSMAVALPDDGVEYIGQYLLQYVERRQLQAKKSEAYEEIKENGKKEAQKEAAANAIAEEKKKLAAEKTGELETFISSLESAGATKQDTMNAVTNFLASYLKVPAVYVAVKRISGETETLNYLSANDSQKHVVGRKLKKPAEEDEVPPRQGCSFEAFKLPPVEEPEEPAEGEDAPPPPPLPVPQPLVIDNVMRDSRIQFFGIPKLGSYVAVPFSYNSCDHPSGCQKSEPAAAAEPNEDGTPSAPVAPLAPYVKNNIPVQLIIGADTIGDFRRFSSKDIETIKRVGEQMLRRFEVIEDGLFNSHVAFITAAASASGPIGALIASFPDEETAAATAATTPAALPEEASEEEKAAAAIPPYAEAVARASFYTQKVVLSELADVMLSYLGYSLPPPSAVVQLFYVVGCLCGSDPATLTDACRDPSWDAIKANFITNATSLMHVYDPLCVSSVAKENSFSFIKAYCENNNVFDTSTYVPEMQTLSVINTWLQKNLAAREAAIAFFKETKNEDLETVH